MSIAEEDAADLRVKVSRLEDENESLMTQLKKMSSKNKRTSRRSPSPFGAGAKESDNRFVSKSTLAKAISWPLVSIQRLSVDAIGEEPDSPTSSEEDLRLQLEVSENETAVLRKKVDGLLTDNLKMTKEIKELGNQLKTAKTKVQVWFSNLDLRMIQLINSFVALKLAHFVIIVLRVWTIGRGSEWVEQHSH